MRKYLISFCLLFALLSPLRAEQLVVALSQDKILIESNFLGTELVVFGSVEPDFETISRRGGYDIVVRVSGPLVNYVTRKKERVSGLWINTQAREFVEAPSFLAYLSTRPLDEIATPLILERAQLGLDATIFPQTASQDMIEITEDDPFRTAFIRLKREENLYQQDPERVSFLTSTLFTARVNIPENVPIGTYTVETFLFADGVIIGEQQSNFEVLKVGFEAFVARAAQDYGLLYGFAAALMALTMGWLASVVFRRD